MKDRFEKLIKNFVFPFALGIYRRLSSRGSVFIGPYASWDEARRYSDGYDKDEILDKVKDALLKVKDGKAASERDSVLFDIVQYPFPVLAGLLKAALTNGAELNILDFGGSLGTSYYQCRRFLEGVKIRWSIVEQPKFVDCGKKFFENEELRFYFSIDECLKNEKPQVAFLSGVIQYIEKPYALLEQVLKCGFKYIIFDRTVFIEKGPDKLMVQVAPPHIYKASYPIWFLNKNRVLGILGQDYKLGAEFGALSGTMFIAGKIIKDTGLIFVRKGHFRPVGNEVAKETCV